MEKSPTNPYSLSGELIPQNFHIFIVEDNLTSLTLLSNLLTQKKYNVERAANGREALIKIKAKVPDLILLDIMMPDMDGYEVCRQLKNNEETAHVPIIFLTALDELEEKIKGFNVGAVDYITKPFYAKELLLRLENQLKIKHLNEQLQKQNEALQEREERLNKIISTLSEGLVVLDREGKICFLNPAAEILWERSSQELLGETLDLPLEVGEMRAMEITTPSGETKFAESYTESIVWDNQSAYLISLRDVTERHHKEVRLKLLQRAVDSADNGIVISDATKPDNPIIYVNAGFERLTGYTAAEVVGKNCRFLQGSDKNQTGLRELRKAIEEGQGCSVLLQNYRKDGSIFWNELTLSPIHDEAGKVTHYLGIQVDITTRLEAEQVLRESEERFRSMADSTAMLLWVADELGNCTFVNQTWLEMTGKSLAEELGGGWLNEVHPQDYTLCWETYEKAIAARVSFEVEYRLRRFDGEYRWLLAQGKPRFWQNGTFAGYVGSCLDITERKQVEVALQEAKETAENANHSKSVFLASMSHELRTPLNAILGFSQLLAGDRSLTPNQQENLKFIHRSGEHLLNLINDILSMSAIEAGRVVLQENGFDLYQLLNSIKAIFDLKAQAKGLQLNFIYTPQVPQYIQTDEQKLRQVLLNLIDNAIKFTEVGSVEVRVSPSESLPSAPNTLSLKFAIEDTGCGISPQEFTKLFQPFIQTRSNRQITEGTGLGLPISREYVRLMGGDIRIESEIDRGSLFEFEISVGLIDQVKKSINIDSQKVISLAPNQPRYKILIVEDVLANRQLMHQILEPLGFDVQEVTNGREAIKLWQEWQPNVIFMDVKMPEMDGYEATKIIRAKARETNAPKVTIIALTASVFDEKKEILSVGCDDFLNKPVQENAILAKLNEYLGVNYLYYQQEEGLGNQNASEGMAKLTKEDLLIMPQEWIEQLHIAALQIDEQKVFDLLEQVPSSEGRLVKIIKHLVENFRIDAIIDLTEELCE